MVPGWPYYPGDSVAVSNFIEKTSETEPDEPLADPRVQRVINLLGQIGLRAGDCARLLQNLAEWYQPNGMRACEVCGEQFKPRRRTARYRSKACKQVKYRRNT